ncbi:peptidoglycan-binding protein [Streptomyces griseochromogenes]|uniref:peptidoglycan-binding protein n=1 Tax=Streptomyces griseochromogenes TaxID=68214 RepID=UPI0037A9B5A3
MPFEQHINWTVLPHGFSEDGTQAKVSVFIAPRLLTPDGKEGTLASFPDFVRWPEKIMAATFEFATELGTATPPVPAPFTGPLKPQDPPPVTELWTSLFDEGTPLLPYAFPPGERNFRTYSAREVGGYTKGVYAGTARDFPETPPSTLDAMSRQTPSSTAGETVAAVTSAPGVKDSATPPPLAGLEAFHRTSQAPGLVAGEPVKPSKPPSPPPADFHAMLTSLGDHPVLLRRLGLVLEFLLPIDRLPVSSGELLLTVIPRWTPALRQDSYDVPCRTRYFFNPDPLSPDHRLFVPAAQAPADGDTLASPSRGLVVLDETKFSVEQADIDGAALKMLSVPQGATGLSPVRTHGISLVRNDRLNSLKDEFGRADVHNKAFNGVAKQQGATLQTPAPQSPGAGPEEAAPQDEQEPASAPELLAKDVVRGHRMDIWDESLKAWFSLYERDVEYRKPHGGPLLLTASDEGFFQAHLASAPDDSTMHVPEQLATWDGWSQAAPHPGLVLDTDIGSPDQNIPPNKPVPPRNDPGMGLDLEITVKARPASLPRLRYGHPYRVRLRTVDLAGNGLDFPGAEALMKYLNGVVLPEAEPLVFRRYEPVPAPAVVPRLVLGEGASAFRMVIRSSPGAVPPPAAATGSAARVSLANVRFGRTNEDVRTVQKALVAEGHNLPHGADSVFGDETRTAYAEEQRDQGFSGSGADGDPGCQTLTELGRKNGFSVDCGAGPGADASAGSTAEQYAADFNRSSPVTSEGHVPYQGIDERHVVAPKASLQCVEWHGLLDPAIGSTDHAVQDAVYDLAIRENGSLSDPHPDVVLKSVKSPAADPNHPAIIALHTGEQVELPYLPDPRTTGAVLLDLPGLPAGEPFPIPWDGDVWHRPKSFRLRLAEGSGPPRFDDGSRVLTVSLPKGTVATVRLCSRIDLDEAIMGMASWCRKEAPQAPGAATETEAEAAARMAAESQRADQVLELAAASRHWMFTPWHELTLVHAVQQPVKTPVLTLLLPPPTSPRPEHATAEHLAGTIALDEDSTGRVDLVAEWTEVTDAGPTGRDTRRMTAPVFGMLTDRANRDSAPGTEPAVLQNGVLTFSTQVSEDKAKAAAAAAATDKDKAKRTPLVLEKHEFGDTKHRTVHYRPLAGSKFADYFPAQYAEPGRHTLTVQGAAQEYSVLSSAQPTAPRLLYCVPTLALEHADGPSGAIVHRRRGGGIRVYLDRPWFSSGDGELLGVVLGEPPGGDPASLRDAWVTLMGRDPIHRSAPVVAPTADVFTNAVRHSETLSLPPPNDPLTVTVVGFTPQFDADEKGGRWFCDLELDTKDACLPFVRLALVRYQPESIPGAKLSSVVLADLVRTLPDRELTVRPGQPLTVSVTGPSWDPTGARPPQITATLQRRHDVVTDHDLGWVTLEDTVTQLTSIDAESSHRPFYTGQIPIPPVRRGVPLRLMVVETEGIQADGPTAPTPPGPVLYCDTVDLPPGQDTSDGHGRPGDGDDGRGDGRGDGRDGRGDGRDGRDGRGDGRDGRGDGRGGHGGGFSHH